MNLLWLLFSVSLLSSFSWITNPNKRNEGGAGGVCSIPFSFILFLHRRTCFFPSLVRFLMLAWVGEIKEEYSKSYVIQLLSWCRTGILSPSLRFALKLILSKKQIHKKKSSFVYSTYSLLFIFLPKRFEVVCQPKLVYQIYFLYFPSSSLSYLNPRFLWVRNKFQFSFSRLTIHLFIIPYVCWWRRTNFGCEKEEEEGIRNAKRRTWTKLVSQEKASADREREGKPREANGAVWLFLPFLSPPI